MKKEIKELLDNAYKRSTGINEYKGCTDILYKELFEDNVNKKNKQKMLRLRLNEVHTLVLEYQKTQDRLIFDAIVENYTSLIFSIVRRYYHVACNIKVKKKNGNVMMDTDLYSEAILILHRCMERFVIQEGRKSSFAAFLYGEIRGGIIVQIRKKYYDVAVTPPSVYREYRKLVIKEGGSVNIGGEMSGIYRKQDVVDGEDNVAVLMDEDEMSQVLDLYFDDGESDNMVIELLDRLIPNKLNLRIFCLAYGIGCEKVKSVDIGKHIGLSRSAISKKLKAIRESLEDNPEILALYHHHKSNNSLMDAQK